MTPQHHPLAPLLPPLRYACQRDFARLSKVRDLRSALEPGLRTAAKGGLATEHVVRLQRELSGVDDPQEENRRAALRRFLAVARDAGLELPPDLAPLLRPSSSSATRVSRGTAEPPGATDRGVDAAEGGNAGAVPVRRAGPSSPVRPGSPASAAAAGSSATQSAAPGARAGTARSAPDAGVGSAQPAGTRPGGGSSAETSRFRPGGEAPPARPPPAPLKPAGRTRQLGLTAARGGAGRAAPRGRREAVGVSESRAEARLLSIAPREGPLSVPLRSLKWRLQPRLIAALERKGVRRAGDVLFLLPRCYEDRRSLQRIAELIPGERGVTVATVKSVGDAPSRRGRRIFRAVLSDETGSIAVTYFQTGPWLKARFPVGKRLILSGEVRASPTGWEMPHPEVEPAEDLESSSVHFNRIVPIYPGFERHEQRQFRELASRVAERFAALIEEPLPASLRQKLGLMGLGEALERIHFPGDGDDLDRLDRHISPAHRRLAFDELFFLQLGLALRRRGTKSLDGIAFDTGDARLTEAESTLPFSLTRAQARVVREIARDMGRPEPMNRLLQGDVGSGKTAVALVSSLLALKDGYQVALMAPTEILAEQHHRTFSRLLEAKGYRSVLVSAGGTQRHKREAREALRTGEARVAIGTHALIEGEVEFERLGLVIIDEQHRFGVMQRHRLMSKGRMPDVLVMTATPIPRTLAMTLYGDLDTSRIDELPPGRTPIETRVFPAGQRARVYESIAQELKKGHQAYVVYPLVEESEKLDLDDATQGAEKLQRAFPEHVVGLLHGRLKPEEKEYVMRAFRDGQVHILVCTTVVEVGVDVPNASVMVIESAERFGLSQLHQLRGRVGRGAAKSFCYLVSQSQKSIEAAERLAVMEKSNDGVVIAEKDLEIRGPGEFLGTRQSGMPELAVANLARDGLLLQSAREEAMAVVERDPVLGSAENAGLVKALEERWEGRLALARVG